MLNSFEEFKTAVQSCLKDRVLERIAAERESISNSLLLGGKIQDSEQETQSNKIEN